MGVVLNNRAATLLTIAIFETVDSNTRNRLLNKAEENIKTAIKIYTNWQNNYGTLPKDSLKNIYTPIYENLKIYDEEESEKYLDKRVNDILEAQLEIPRRLSVSYTNLGMINRYKGDIHSALQNYKLAIELWENNLAAENNINIIMGLPIKERGILERLFPPKK